MLSLVEAVAACLDRESAKKLVRLDLNAELRMAHQRTIELHDVKGRSQDALAQQAGQAMDYIAGAFVAHLQREARRILRQPVGKKRP